MLVVLVNWLYIVLTTYLAGNACMRLLSRLFGGKRADQAPSGSPFWDLFAGIMCTTCYAQIFSLFAGVRGWANLFLLIFCAVYLAFFHSKIKKELSDRTSGSFFILAVVLLLAAFAFALVSAGPAKLIDTDWYHAQTIRWIEEFGCVTGVANLFYSLGFNSAQHYFDALYSMRAVLGQSLHATGGYFGLLLFCHGLCRLRSYKSRKRHIADALALAEVIYAIIITAFFADPYTDTLPNCLVFFILTEWISLLEEEEKEIFPYAFLCVFGVFATVVKTSVVMVVLLVIQPAVWLVREKEWKKIAGYLLTGILIAVPFFITNVKTTGYLVYLASGVDLFDVPWKIDGDILRYSVDSMIHDARAVNATMEEALGSGLAWIPGWFKNDSISHQILYIAVFLLLLLDLVLTTRYILSLRRQERSKQLPGQLSMLLPRIIVVIGLVYWLFTIPQVKYCWAFLLFPLTVIPAVHLERIASENNASSGKKLYSRLPAFLAAFTGGIVLLMYTGFYGLRTLGYMRDAFPAYLVRQADYELHTMKPVEKDGLTFYIREEGGDIVCGYYVFPYLNDEELLDRLVVGEKLSDGFYLEKE